MTNKTQTLTLTPAEIDLILQSLDLLRTHSLAKVDQFSGFDGRARDIVDTYLAQALSVDELLHAMFEADAVVLTRDVPVEEGSE